MKLKISKKNKRYFEYKGKIFPLIGSGLGQDTPGGKLLAELLDAGVNQILWLILPGLRRSHPYKVGAGAGVDNNWGGFEPGYWKKLQDYAKHLAARGAMLFVCVFSTCIRKRGKGTWQNHLWNSENGGPISASNGVFPFYERGSDKFLFGKKSYDSLNTWQEKNQYRQEQLLAEVVKKLKQFDNIAIILVWEIYAGLEDSKITNAKNWSCHMVRFIDSRCDIPVGLATWRTKQIEYVKEKTGIDIFSFMEGSVPSCPIFHGKERDDLLKLGDYPLVVDGWQAQLPDTRYSILQKTRKCKYFLPGMEKENVNNICSHIVRSIRKGANISLPFDFWWKKISQYVTKDCGSEFPDVKKYDMEFAKAEIFKFMKRFKDELDGIDWNREPGNTITKTWAENLIPFGAGPVKEAPVARFSYSPEAGESPLKVEFDAGESYDPDGAIASYHWDFGDGQRGEGKTVSHSYMEKGTYTIKLTVVDKDGLKGNATGNVSVSEPAGEKEWQVIKRIASRDGVVLEIEKRADEKSMRVSISCPEDKDSDEVECYKLFKQLFENLSGLIDCFVKSPNSG